MAIMRTTAPKMAAHEMRRWVYGRSTSPVSERDVGAAVRSESLVIVDI
jgi:hypothetical protein